METYSEKELEKNLFTLSLLGRLKSSTLGESELNFKCKKALIPVTEASPPFVSNLIEVST